MGGRLINGALFMVIIRLAPPQWAAPCSHRSTSTYIIYSELHGLTKIKQKDPIIYPICILYIFTNLFPSHNHSIREVGQALAGERIGTRGAGHPAEGMGSLQVIWGSRDRHWPKGRRLSGPAGVRVEGGERGFPPSLLLSFLPQLFTGYPLYAWHGASC